MLSGKRISITKPVQVTPPAPPSDNFDNEFFDSQCEEAKKQLEHIEPVKEDFREKMTRLENNVDKISEKIHSLQEKYSDLDIEELVSKKVSPKKQEAARAFIKAQIAKKRELMKHIHKLKKSEQERHQAAQASKLAMEQAEKARRMEQLRQLIPKGETRQLQKKQCLEREGAVKRFYQEHDYTRRLHLELETKDKQQQKRDEEYKIAILKKRRERYQPFTDNEFLHPSGRTVEMQQLKKREKEERMSQIQEENMKLAEKIYRGKAYYRAESEAALIGEARLKRDQRLKKAHSYVEYVRENFKPIDNQEETVAETKEVDESKKQIRRYRFLQGKSCGQIVEILPVSKSLQEQQKIGNAYLQYMRRLPKKKVGSVSEGSVGDKMGGVGDKMGGVGNKMGGVGNKMSVPRSIRPKEYRVKLSGNPNRAQIEGVLMQLRCGDELVAHKERYAAAYQQEGRGSSKEINDSIIQSIEKKLSMLKQL